MPTNHGQRYIWPKERKIQLIFGAPSPPVCLRLLFLPRLAWFVAIGCPGAVPGSCRLVAEAQCAMCRLALPPSCPFLPFLPPAATARRKWRSLLTLDPRPADVQPCRLLWILSILCPFCPVATLTTRVLAHALALAMNTMVARFDHKSCPAGLRTERDSMTCP